MSNERLLFFIKENLPSENGRIEKSALVEYVAQDMLSVGESINLADVYDMLIVLNEKQHIVLFSNGSVAMTRHGEHCWKKG